MVDDDEVEQVYVPPPPRHGRRRRLAEAERCVAGVVDGNAARSFYERQGGATASSIRRCVEDGLARCSAT